MLSFLNGVEHQILQNLVENDEKYNDIHYDSRKVTENDIFVALEGSIVDGHNYIKNAYENGAKCIIVSKKVDLEFPITYILVENLRKKLAIISSNFYQWPQNKLKIIGFTGTNGKTSSTYFLENIIGSEKVARLGTIEYKIGNDIVEAENTTPESLDIVKFCKKAVERNMEYLIMEISSHALEIGRVDMLSFDVAIFTNLTQDHLDFHESMENYFNAKRRLFFMLKEKKHCVINIDDSYGKILYDDVGGISYGINSMSQIHGRILHIENDGQEVEIKIEDKLYNLKINLLGKFNLYNILGVIGAAKILGFDNGTIMEKIKTLKDAPGRYELVNCLSDFSVIIDYSHTEDSLENILLSLNEIKKGKIITIFGCGGDRDKTKRPKMGKVAENMSDIAIVTSDNPRTEIPEEIIKDIVSGLSKDNHIVICDREEAISKGIELATKNDIILIAGKGHETYQVVGRKKYHFDDRDIACREIVKKRQNQK
ncbi:UDP-N-acetylmuramoyl-L-alanyl-D-glutamate--2,6-diaminopimelate ligase [Fusobacterium sp. PH5-44]|uniref:UDP-N-acetylmuramoyl-L-alanyl-D-glutamate--2, 6-diaminopimelate ligase n=1 Tax=unclassified Fusobacterium TaxID=2648384 RepID=UPI003D25F9EA